MLASTAGRAGAADVWVSGYYPGWEQHRVPPEKVPLGAVTHLFHFALGVRPDGSLDADQFDLTDAHVRATVAAAHDAKRKVSIVLGGEHSGKGFSGATSPANRAKFIANVIASVKKHGYDGIDVDWEPLDRADNEKYRAFIIELRAAMRQADPKLLLSTATGPSWDNPDVEKLHAELQGQFDQINVMTYVLAGAWPGWVTWHGSALFNGGNTFASGRAMPSIETVMAGFVVAGVKPDKLGIGLAFHGSVWSGGAGTDTGGVTRPLQAWKDPPKVESDIAYHEVMRQFHAPDRLHFDPVTQSAYLSIDRPGSADDRFVSFTDAQGITARLRFLHDKGYGGAIVWNIAQDTLPTGEHPLADAVARWLQKAGR